MVVHTPMTHRIQRGDSTMDKYNSEPDMILELGKTKVYIFGPVGLTEEELQARDFGLHQAVANILRESQSSEVR